MLQHIVSYFDLSKDVSYFHDEYVPYKTLFYMHIAIFFFPLSPFQFKPSKSLIERV